MTLKAPTRCATCRTLKDYPLSFQAFEVWLGQWNGVFPDAAVECDACRQRRLGGLPARRNPPTDRDEVLRRYPALVAHLICESLGYFTPVAAANALLDYIQGGSNYCEWYDSMAEGRFKRAAESARYKGLAWQRPTREEYDAELIKVGKDVLLSAIRNRRGHAGYMAEYQHARRLVDAVNAGKPGPTFASWF